MRVWKKRRDDVDVASCLANLDRLNAVAASGLMDAPRRADLDELTRSAATELHAPMAFVSVLDDRRQFFVSDFGTTDEATNTRGTTIDASYCQHVVALDDVLVVTDARSDPLVADNPATHDGTRAYLGVPLRREGFCLGSFCVVDTQPREWTQEDLASLQRLADEAMVRIR